MFGREDELQNEIVKLKEENKKLRLFLNSIGTLKININKGLDAYLSEQHSMSIRTPAQLSKIKAAVCWTRKITMEIIDKHFKMIMGI